MPKKICVLGLGYIGLPTALLLANSGYSVTGVDINEKVVKTLNSGELPFKEPGLRELLENAGKNFTAKTQVERADVFIVAVPTPIEKFTKVSDLSYVRLASEMIVPVLKQKNLVILESTVPPGTGERLVIPILEKSGLEIGDFYFAYCPERAIPGRTLYEMVHNDRVVGGYDQLSGKLAKEVYASFVKGEIHITDLKTAEFVKLIENTYRDVNIALANEFALIAEECGIDVWKAIELANRHPRVNILNPGPGVGGHCIAIDPWFLTEHTTRGKLVLMARDVNDYMPNYVLQNVRKMLESIRDATITVFGVAYKGNVDDTRETPALKFIRLAKNEGYEVKCYDPYVSEFEFELCSLEDAVRESDCIVVMTDHSVFKEIDPNYVGKFMRHKQILDTRNIVNREKWNRAGFKVKVLGDGRKV
ncbi:nucleotide sugar dehydrogenase [Geoglobus acetivorans]|uniref:UDP-N-acetyl-D-mannosamine dehydrogenase n=1 Tax=Geoglobus acetivorans TaxID=565033 RepID=A0ABZ3H561_GEOAI|nr:nucleotide sugar dehydrogenase [Geoglobus acetivorans]